MQERVRVSLVQFASQWLQRDINVARMKEWAEREAQNGVQLILFPETANIGYITPTHPGELPEWDDHTTASEFAAMYIRASEKVPGPTTEALAQVASRYGVYIIVGISQLHPVIPATLYNSAVLIGPEGVIGVHHKMHLGASEKTLFYPGNTCQMFPTPLGNIGVIVCYDRRFPELTRALALQGAEIVVAPTANAGYHPSGGKMLVIELIKAVTMVRAHENGVYFLTCNRTGLEGKARYAGHSIIAAPNGEVVAYLDSDEEGALRADLYDEELVKLRAARSIFRDRRPELYYDLVKPLSAMYTPETTEASLQLAAVSDRD